MQIYRCKYYGVGEVVRKSTALMLTHRILSRGSATAHGLDAGPLDANANMYSIFLDNLPVSMYISRSTSMRWGKINRGKGAKVGRPRNSQRRTMDDDNTKLAEMGGSLHGPILYREWNCYPRWRDAPWELIVSDMRGHYYPQANRKRVMICKWCIEHS